MDLDTIARQLQEGGTDTYNQLLVGYYSWAIHTGAIAEAVTRLMQLQLLRRLLRHL